MDGAEFCRRVRALDQIEYTCFLMLTAMPDGQHMIDGCDAGVADFVATPFHPGELPAPLRAGLRTNRLHDELQQGWISSEHGCGVASASGGPGVVWGNGQWSQLRTTCGPAKR